MNDTQADEIARLKQILEQQSYIALVNYDAAMLHHASLQQLWEMTLEQSRQTNQLLASVNELLEALEKNLK